MITKEKKICLFLLVPAFAVFFLNGCTKDYFGDFSEMDGDSTWFFEQDNLDVDFTSCEYLDYKYKDWNLISSQERAIIAEAQKRLDIKLIDGFYVLPSKNYKAYNISDRLFDYIVNNFLYLNAQIARYDSTPGRMPLMLRGNPEGGQNTQNQYDCVAIALCHMSGGPSYSAATRWLTDNIEGYVGGGVPIGQINYVVSNLTTATSFTGTLTDGSLNNGMLVVSIGVSSYHAVNAKKYVSSKTLLKAYDYQNANSYNVVTSTIPGGNAVYLYY